MADTVNNFITRFNDTSQELGSHYEIVIEDGDWGMLDIEGEIRNVLEWTFDNGSVLNVQTLHSKNEVIQVFFVDRDEDVELMYETLVGYGISDDVNDIIGIFSSLDENGCTSLNGKDICLFMTDEGINFAITEPEYKCVIARMSDSTGTFYAASCTDDKINIQKEPSMNSESIGQLNEGDLFTVHGEEGEWSKIVFNGKEGYILTQYIKVEGWLDEPEG